MKNIAGEQTWRFFGAAGAEVAGYDGDRDTFLGDYRSYGNPLSVENGQCSNSLNYNAKCLRCPADECRATAGRREGNCLPAGTI
ncbi:hypothetical protein ACFTAO_49355 [Paenibacillus rhizoplanae]